MTEHKQIRIRPPWYRGGWVNVDEEMAPFLRWLWDHGAHTYASCQDCGDPWPNVLDNRRRIQEKLQDKAKLAEAAELGFTEEVWRDALFRHLNYGPAGSAQVCFYFKEHAEYFIEWLSGIGVDPSAWCAQESGMNPPWKEQGGPSVCVWFPRTLLKMVKP
jgi:hypothetical protein